MKNILTISFLLICGLCFGQNLVPNGDFEQYNICPTSSAQIDRAIGWNGFSSEYYNSCDTTPQGWSVPENGGGYQVAASGNAYAGIIPFLVYNSYSEFVTTELSAPLIIGQKYYASIKVSLTEYSTCAVNNLGILFSTDTFNYWQSAPTNIQPQVYSPSVITDSINWTTISASFIADSAYQYLAVGNFFDTANVTTVCVSPLPYYYYYYFVDDVCVSTDSLTCLLPVGLREAEQSVLVSLFPNPFSNQLDFQLSNSVQTTVLLYDFLSRQILQQSFTSSTTINTEQLADGIYFYELRTNRGTIKTGKVIKH